MSRVISVGRRLGRRSRCSGGPSSGPPAKTLFGWFQRACGISERSSARRFTWPRSAAVPGKNAAGGDRVPDAQEIVNVRALARSQRSRAQTALVFPSANSPIQQFVAFDKLTDLIGKNYRNLSRPHLRYCPAAHLGCLAVAPHGAGADSHRQALELIIHHPAWPPPRPPFLRRQRIEVRQ